MAVMLSHAESCWVMLTCWRQILWTRRQLHTPRAGLFFSLLTGLVVRAIRLWPGHDFLRKFMQVSYFRGETYWKMLGQLIGSQKSVRQHPRPWTQPGHLALLPRLTGLPSWKHHAACHGSLPFCTKATPNLWKKMATPAESTSLVGSLRSTITGTMRGITLGETSTQPFGESRLDQASIQAIQVCFLNIPGQPACPICRRQMQKKHRSLRSMIFLASKPLFLYPLVN